MTSQELAELCGVSKTTVSRVINNDPNVKSETRQKILAAMKEHNYVPAASARRLAGIDSTIIGLFILDINISNSISRVSKSSYFSTLTTLVIDKANCSGFQVLTSIITNEQQLEEARRLFSNGTIFSGIIIGAFNDSKEVSAFMELGYPLVIVDKQNDDPVTGDKSLFIDLDNYFGAYEATKYLIELGHEAIGHITGDLRKLSGIERLRGYKEALSEAGIPYDHRLVKEGDFQELSGYELGKKLVDETEITAIFSGNDNMAIGAIKAIRERGYDVPGDYAIVGYDNIEAGNYTTPTLSTVSYRLEEVAKYAIESLEYFRANKFFEKGKILLESELVKRESTTKR